VSEGPYLQTFTNVTS